MKKTCYYAHCQSIYGTPIELRDIELLESLGFEVVNPSDNEIVADFNRWKQDHVVLGAQSGGMAFWEELAMQQDVLAFRALPDGRIPAGVFKEIKAFKGPVVELPYAMVSRDMTVDETREYLCLSGQR